MPGTPRTSVQRPSGKRTRLHTVNTIPEKARTASADHGCVGTLLSPDGGETESVIATFRKAGIDDAALAAQLQREVADSFDASWKDLLQQLAAKRGALAGGHATVSHS